MAKSFKDGDKGRFVCRMCGAVQECLVSFELQVIECNKCGQSNVTDGTLSEEIIEALNKPMTAIRAKTPRPPKRKTADEAVQERKVFTCPICNYKQVYDVAETPRVISCGDCGLKKWVDGWKVPYAGSRREENKAYPSREAVCYGCGQHTSFLLKMPRTCPMCGRTLDETNLVKKKKTELSVKITPGGVGMVQENIRNPFRVAHGTIVCPDCGYKNTYVKLKPKHCEQCGVVMPGYITSVCSAKDGKGRCASIW